jgi:hypothetical protein
VQTVVLEEQVGPAPLPGGTAVVVPLQNGRSLLGMLERPHSKLFHTFAKLGKDPLVALDVVSSSYKD